MPDRGILALANELGPVSTVAGQVLNVLNGGVIAKLQTFINQKLDLTQIEAAVAAADPSKVEQWLQNRLGNFLDKTIGLDDLRDIQNAIQTLNTKVKGYYATAVQTLTKHYSVSFASTYQSTTTDTALLDVNFDLSNLDDLLTVETAGVTLNQAKLTHEINRKGTVDLNMPWFDFSSTSVTVANRAASRLSVPASPRVAAGQAPQLDSSGSIAYEMRQVRAAMRPADLEARTTTFIHSYLNGLFSGGDASIRSFYTDLDNAITAATGNQSNFLGDVAVSMQLSLQAAVLGAWFRPRNASELRADQMQLSRTLQAAWKNLLPALYFQDPSQYSFNESVAALLVWSSIPISTSIDFDDAHSTINRFNTDKDVFWNWPDVNLRRAIARDSHTIATLSGQLAGIRSQLLEAGSANAGFFTSLLFTEAQLVGGATDALKQISAALSDAATAPTKTITTLAQFATDITNTFNQRVGSVYSGMSGRVVGPMLLVEASRALGGPGTRPT